MKKGKRQFNFNRQPLKQKNSPIKATSPTNKSSGVGFGRISRHAKERMHLREITLQCAEEVCRHGQKEYLTNRRERVSLGDTSVIWDKHTHDVVTVIKTSIRNIPCGKDMAMALIEEGRVKAISKQLGIKIRYMEESRCFELSGDEKNLRRGVIGMERAYQNIATKLNIQIMEGAANDAVRIPVKSDCRGLIESDTIKQLEKDLVVKDIQISWDENTNELVLETRNRAVNDKLRRRVEDILRRHGKKLARD